MKKVRQQQIEQFYKIGQCELENYNENKIKGDDIEAGHQTIKTMNIICNYCHALKWKNEPNSFCCMNGQVKIALLASAPNMLYNLLTTNDPNTNRLFVEQIRAYNSVFAFTSLEVNLDETLANAKEGVYIFRIQGALYYKISFLISREIEGRRDLNFVQIYFYDLSLNNQVTRQMNLMPTLNENMIQAIQNELYEINPFVNVFYQTGFEADNYPDLTLTIHSTHRKDMRQYNQPTVPEIAAIILENYENTVIQKRDILLKTHTGKLQKISELHGAYDPLQYPLLFPYGEYGWHDNILRANEIITTSDNKQSDDEFKEFKMKNLILIKF